MYDTYLRDLLQARIPESRFAGCWSDASPPYVAFLDDAARRLAGRFPNTIKDLTVSIREYGSKRVRLDGSFVAENQSLVFYAEMVWLPSSQTFRGNVNIREAPRTPSKKTVPEFIKALDAIQDESHTILIGQAFNAMEGLAEDDVDVPQSYPAIFRLFERFPEEDFGNPGHLVHLIVTHGGHESLLAKSLKRTPSIPALILAHEFASTAQPLTERVRWVNELKRVAARDDVSLAVRELAQDLLQQQL